MSGDKSERTSQYFVADVGILEDATAARWIQWCRDKCVAHAVERHDDGSISLYLQRNDEASVRARQRLLYTLGKSWSMPLGRRGGGWLRLLTADEFAGAHALSSGSDCNAAETASPSTAVPRVHGGLCAGEHAAVILHLPADFAERSHDMLQALRAAAVH